MRSACRLALLQSPLIQAPPASTTASQIENGRNPSQEVFMIALSRTHFTTPWLVRAFHIRTAILETLSPPDINNDCVRFGGYSHQWIRRFAEKSMDSFSLGVGKGAISTCRLAPARFAEIQLECHAVPMVMDTNSIDKIKTRSSRCFLTGNQEQAKPFKRHKL